MLIVFFEEHMYVDAMSLHASIALYITHIKFTYTVTRLTSNINEISEVL